MGKLKRFWWHNGDYILGILTGFGLWDVIVRVGFWEFLDNLVK